MRILNYCIVLGLSGLFLSTPALAKGGAVKIYKTPTPIQPPHTSFRDDRCDDPFYAELYKRIDITSELAGTKKPDAGADSKNEETSDGNFKKRLKVTAYDVLCGAFLKKKPKDVK